jgi:hypothetical protein
MSDCTCMAYDEHKEQESWPLGARLDEQIVDVVGYPQLSDVAEQTNV